MAMPTGASWIGSNNRKPRVHIELQQLNSKGLPVNVELPHVMGVMADLSGPDRDSVDDVPSEYIAARGDLDERKFRPVKIKGFDDFIKTMQPRVSFTIPQTLTDTGGSIEVDLTIESMDDFTPGGIALKVEPLRKLFEARNNIKALQAYLKKKKAKQLAAKLIANPEICMAAKWLMFSLEVSQEELNGLVEELNANRIPERLRDEFKEKVATLAEDATIGDSTEGAQWQIKDANADFVIKVIDDSLYVYLVPPQKASQPEE